MRQTATDRALYYRQLRDVVRGTFLPELTSATAVDAAALVDRILAEFIVEEEHAAALSDEFGQRFAELLDGSTTHDVVSTDVFLQLRARAMEIAASDDELGDSLAAVERDFLERVDALRVDVLDDRGTVPSTGTIGCSITREQLTSYLRRRLAASPALVVDELTVVPGGRSKETILATLSGTTELPRAVIVRKDRPIGVLQTRASDEFALISAVHSYGGVPIPEPFFAESEGHELGLGEGTFEVMACVPGTKAGEYFPDLAAPSTHRVEIGLQLASALARIHTMPLEHLAGTSLEEHAPVTEASIVGAIGAITGRIAELSGPACVAVPRARQWLLDHVGDVVPAPRMALLQGDFGLHNTLVDGATVTALVDWEAAAVGPPARELAAAWNPITTLMPWSTFVDAYTAAGGSPADADQKAIDFYRVFAALGAFMTSRMGGHLFRTGDKRDLLTAHSGLDSHFRCARNLARALDDAMSTHSTHAGLSG